MARLSWHLNVRIAGSIHRMTLTLISFRGTGSLAQPITLKPAAIPSRNFGMSRLIVERAESFHDVVKAHRLLAAGRVSQ
jgi:hypothetical protein